MTHLCLILFQEQIQSPEWIYDTNDADVGHEAKIGRISDEAIFYLMSRGISEEDAKSHDRKRLCKSCIQGTSA